MLGSLLREISFLGKLKQRNFLCGQTELPDLKASWKGNSFIMKWQIKDIPAGFTSKQLLRVQAKPYYTPSQNKNKSHPERFLYAGLYPSPHTFPHSQSGGWERREPPFFVASPNPDQHGGLILLWGPRAAKKWPLSFPLWHKAIIESVFSHGVKKKNTTISSGFPYNLVGSKSKCSSGPWSWVSSLVCWRKLGSVLGRWCSYNLNL